MQKIYFFLLCLFPLMSCSQNKTSESPVEKNNIIIPQQNFTTLKFEAEGKPCIALINNRYIGYKEKSKFSLSLFIMVNTIDKNKDGHPDEKETEIFNTLQTEIISELSKVLGPYCYVGTTTMPGYRDILLYINPEEREKATDILKKLKEKNSRIDTISFEEDTEWEAVASFYEAISLKN
ncbi:MAG: hypothetical protein B7X86_13230 [Sphingobacteriales bacterium 17-39-43]|uniref:DUF695 domain-containing protein n=1 Tax=Daejeonella sp. TaxID=2805397 RepID=UPI000BD6F571|nr:DUF695 domain-containing protein [Daejeonella sp.]OYZ30507.1 MAG: hypothetical protein B7Y24_12875 [Sphingobacteriales bacterium 16-39-50]OZA23239.1 MAG: hypothetical protein B7X86_13230 [Sphingobacteriales bacterium 17-39-43]HQT24097.1 DUF695 domain-containing protein [Daejeonella sp.]HQT58935.1 DUF695 domain-containing protein [Daejeonella sp.]